MVMELVPNEKKYWDFIRTLRNNERVQVGFIEKVNIIPEQQADYMNIYKDNYYVCLLNGKPVGYIGVIDGDIRVATHPNFQGQGIGVFMIRQLHNIHPKAYAKIKIDNIPSLKAFEKAGFKIKYYILENND